MLVVSELFNIAANDFDAKEFDCCERLLVVTELVVNSTQCSFRKEDQMRCERLRWDVQTFLPNLVEYPPPSRPSSQTTKRKNAWTAPSDLTNCHTLKWCPSQTLLLTALWLTYQVPVPLLVSGMCSRFDNDN